jgi:hypothetical protein
MSVANGSGGDHKTSLQCSFTSELTHDADTVVRTLHIDLSPSDMAKLYGLLFAVRSAAKHGADVISYWFMPFEEIRLVEGGVGLSVDTVHVNVFPDGEVTFEVEFPDGGPRCESATALVLDNEAPEAP